MLTNRKFFRLSQNFSLQNLGDLIVIWAPLSNLCSGSHWNSTPAAEVQLGRSSRQGGREADPAVEVLPFLKPGLLGLFVKVVSLVGDWLS